MDIEIDKLSSDWKPLNGLRYPMTLNLTGYRTIMVETYENHHKLIYAVFRHDFPVEELDHLYKIVE